MRRLRGITSAPVKHAIRVILCHILYALGLLQLWQRIVLRRKAVVLMYHRVLTPEECMSTTSHPGIVVGCNTFTRQMELLKQRFCVLPLEEFSRRLEQGVPFENSSCLITFDDGWKDNYTNAFPVLRRLALPAVVFLPVNFVGGNRMFYQERLTSALVKTVAYVRTKPERRQQVREALASLTLESIVELTDVDPRLAVAEAVAQIKGADAAWIEATLTRLEDEMGIHNGKADDVDMFLDWQQVESMSGHGIAFGGHGVEHRLLTNIPLDEARDEIETPKKVLEERFPSQVASFSYPNGNWSPAVVDLVRQTGYGLAFTTQPGFVACEDDRFTVRRMNIHEGITDTTPMFLARVVGLL